MNNPIIKSPINSELSPVNNELSPVNSELSPVNKELIDTLLQSYVKRKEPFDITVVGVSMEPVLYEGDIIRLQPQEDYEDYLVGDILVFNYNDDELLAHRLLQKKDGLFYCKGDNCYRLEEVTPAQIIGRVTHISNKEVPPCPPKLIALSYAVSQRFAKLNNDYKLAQQTDVYRLYAKIYIRREANPMLYQKNNEMNYIQTDETSLAVFDSDSGDTHFFDEQGIDILNILEEPVDMETLIVRLCEIYDSAPEVIQADVKEFISHYVEKKVVIAL